MLTTKVHTVVQYQYPILPTGCEVTATSILLNSVLKVHSDKCKLDVNKITKESLADCIIKEQDPDCNGKSGNPYRAFLGSPYSKDSFGVFHNPIYQLINQLLIDNDNDLNKINAIDLTPISTSTTTTKFKYQLIENESKEYIQSRLDHFEQHDHSTTSSGGDSSDGNDDEEDFKVLKDHLIKYNIPIIIWMTLELKQPNITDEWKDINNSNNSIYWVSPEHCATLSGFNENEVIITDPHTGKIEQYNKSLFLKRWRQMGRQAVSIIIN